MFTIRDFKVGQRVAIHPASDWFMRGVRFAQVVKVGTKVLRVIAVDGPSFPLSPRNVVEILENR